MPGDADPPLVRNQHGGKEGGIRRPFLFRVGCEMLLCQFVQVANARRVDFPCRIRHDAFDRAQDGDALRAFACGSARLQFCPQHVDDLFHE